MAINCCPCVSLNGGVYFAVSSHICIGLLMTGYLTYVFLLINIMTDGFNGDYTFFSMLLLYSLFFLLSGCLIFRGIETKSVRLLKPSVIAFGVVHGLIFVRVIYVILSKLIFGLSSSSTTTSYSKTAAGEQSALSSDTFGIVFFTFLFFSVVIYMALLAIHIRNLEVLYNPGNIFSQVQLGADNGDGNPLYAYNTVVCHP